MYDIKWIRDNPAEFDRRPEAPQAGLQGPRRPLIQLDETRARGHHHSRSERRRAATRPRRKSARPDQAQGRGAASALMAEVADAEGEAAGATRPRPRRRRGAGKGAGAKSRTCRMTKCRTARTSTATSSIIQSAQSATTFAFTPKEHFELGEDLGMMDFELAAKLSGARFVVLQKDWRGLSARWVNSSSITHTDQEAAATPKSIRRCWCATMRCSAPRNCRSLRTISSGLRGSSTVDCLAVETADILSSRRCRDRHAEDSATQSYGHDPNRRSPSDQSGPRAHRRRSTYSPMRATPPARRASAPKRARRDATRAA